MVLLLTITASLETNQPPVAAPRSTIDPACPDGSAIPIEERAATEVTDGFGRTTAPAGVRVFSPAFDVTPAGLVTALITEAGIVRPVDGAGIAENLDRDCTSVISRPYR